jgi:phenylacetate-CoA ligase
MGLRLVLWKLRAWAEHSPVFARYRYVMESQWHSAEVARQNTETALQATLEHAAKTVPYYRKRKADPRDIDSFGTLQRGDAIDNYEALHSDSPPPGPILVAKSGGSSGETVRVLRDRERNAWADACAWRGDAFGTKLPPDARQVSLWGSPFDLQALQRPKRPLSNLYFNRFMLDGFNLGLEESRHLHRQISALRPDILYGYPSSLLAFVLCAQELGLPAMQIPKIMPTGEMLSDETKAVLEGYFKAPVLERYGSREFGAMAHRCELGAWHICQEQIKCEVILSDGSIAESGKGNLLVTALHCYSMPLIRYSIGDIVDLTEVPCACGRTGMRTFTSVMGRGADYVYCPDGRWFNGNAYTVRVREQPIRVHRFIQDEIDHLTLYIVPAEGYTKKDEVDMLARLDKVADGLIKIDLKVVDQIDPLPSGKNPSLINQLPRPDRPGRLAGQ